MLHPRRAPEADLYPSRVGGAGGASARLDPVLHAPGRTRARGPLRPSELARFAREGFVAFQRFLPEEMLSSLGAEVSRLLAERRDDPSPELVREPEGREIRSVFDVHRSVPAFRRLVRHPRLLGVAQQLLGGPVYIHQSRVNVKPAFDGKEFYWHSDFETWHVEDGMPRMRAVSVSLSLTANLPTNGPLMLMSGSHQHYLACPGRTPENHHLVSLRRQEYGVPERDALAWLADQGGIAAPTGPPGSLVLFDCNTMHGSNGNITPHPRTNVFIVYNSVENALVEPFCGLPPRPEHIASRDFRPLEPE